MKDSIHKRLTDHIRKTVGRYEVPYEPGSWEEFQRLQRRRRQPPVVWFRYALAACLLLGVLGVPLWLYTKKSEETRLAVHGSKTGVSDPKTMLPSVENRQRTGAVLPEPSTPKSPEGDFLDLDDSASKSPSGDLGVIGQNRPKTANSSIKNRFDPPKPSFDDFRRNDISTHPHAESIIQTASFALISPRAIRFSLRPARALSLPLSIWQTGPAVAKTEPAKTGSKPVWGVSLAPQSVYAAGSSPTMTVGGGVFSEIPIIKRFSLSTGLAMAQQKFGTKESGQIVMTTNIPHLVSTGIRLTSIDLPLNIRFRPKKMSGMGFYAEAGLSSIAFLNEQYAYTYEQTKAETIFVMGSNGQEQPVTQYRTLQQTTNQSEPAFQKIYWGRIINLSIGVERRLGTQFRLSAEPYVKYPIGPFTRESLMLGSGGVSLRLGFQAGR
ncbi:outer membrane beta-barrel protein [Larkinella terrae]|uniref:Outer membrane beta-barrel protein n=1 Tax=Larkinella terrae TaxID=2025311 RepID=A0A7K0EIG4_9BACT|nr:outer membrane beta-barrel protein [Larkinella terrae]MRS61502.1 outer membrane beta-barrel protein [Larkinella terrae]